MLLCNLTSQLMLIHQVTTIICEYMKKILLKKYKNMGELDQNPYVNKNDKKIDYMYS